MLQVIEWRAPEYTYYPKHKNWYLWLAVITMVLVLAALFTKNFVVVVLILLSAFVVMMYGSRQPEVIKFAVTHRGVRFHERLYPYDTLKSFWIMETAHGRKLIVVSGRVLLPHIVLPLAPEVNSEDLRQYLLQYLKESREEESLADILSDYFGF
jgi:hypothetical protein